MEYTINKLANMSGVSTRTLRYYDETGLLKPARVASSGYRIYGKEQVDKLQQILCYRALDFSLEEIKKLLAAPDFDKEQAFAGHLSSLQKKRQQLDALILNVTKSLNALKGGTAMTDQEKFEGFKQKLIEENEQKYGAEIRANFGDTAIDASNAHMQGMTEAQYDEAEQLRHAFEEQLKVAFATGNPAGDLAQKACDLHRQWLCIYYPNYSKAYHMGLGELYVTDQRFQAYYDKLAAGCATFLRDAVSIYCKS